MYAMLELFAGVFVLTTALDRLAIDTGYATLTAVFFITRALDNLVIGFKDFPRIYDDVTELTWGMLKKICEPNKRSRETV
jgi:hypothetical protein